MTPTVIAGQNCSSSLLGIDILFYWNTVQHHLVDYKHIEDEVYSISSVPCFNIVAVWSQRK